jgi:hypothetical protein
VVRFAGELVERRSDEFHRDVLCMSCEGLYVGFVAGQHSAPRLGEGHDDCVDRGPLAGASSEFGGASGDRVGHYWFNDAGFEEAVGVGVASGVTVEGLHEHDSRDDGWPQVVVYESADERE